MAFAGNWFTAWRDPVGRHHSNSLDDHMLNKSSYGWTYRCREWLAQAVWRVRRRPKITHEIKGTVTDWPNYSELQAKLREMKG